MGAHRARIGEYTAKPDGVAAIRVDPRARFGEPLDVFEAIHFTVERNFVRHLHFVLFLVEGGLSEFRIMCTTNSGEAA